MPVYVYTDNISYWPGPRIYRERTMVKPNGIIKILDQNGMFTAGTIMV